MKKQILVLDLDGTLTNDAKEIGRPTLLALRRLQDEGGTIVLASGRPTYGIMPLAEQLELRERGGYILAYNGGEIVDCRTGGLLHARQLERQVLPTIIAEAERRGLAVLSYRDSEIITTLPADPYVAEESRINRMPVCGEARLMDALPPIVPKMLMTGEPSVLEVVEAELKEQLAPHGVWVYRSAPFFLELVPQGIDKAESLVRLLGHLGMEKESMVCVGDGGNDVSMLRLAGAGVAMCNAPAYVQEAADWVTTRDNNHDGVAEVIERYFFD